jgi:hypothetical protein
MCLGMEKFILLFSSCIECSSAQNYKFCLMTYPLRSKWAPSVIFNKHLHSCSKFPPCSVRWLFNDSNSNSCVKFTKQSCLKYLRMTHRWAGRLCFSAFLAPFTFSDVLTEPALSANFEFHKHKNHSPSLKLYRASVAFHALAYKILA